jgi:hypothetical protein
MDGGTQRAVVHEELEQRRVALHAQSPPLQVLLEEQRVAEGDAVEGTHFDKDPRPLQIFKVLVIEVLVLAALTLAMEKINRERRRGGGGGRRGGERDRERETKRVKNKERA